MKVYMLNISNPLNFGDLSENNLIKTKLFLNKT